VRRDPATQLILGVMALAVLTVGLIGAYSYGAAYSVHRGFTSLVQLPRAGTGRLLQVNFTAKALHRKADYLVYLPPGYTKSHRYPVYYLLHGSPGKPQVFVDIANMDVRLDNQRSEGTVKPMILVYPDGRINGSTMSDSEWANTSSGNFQGYVTDVVRDVDQRFATLPYRQDRVIAGFSAGAYGAMNIALHELALFRNVQVWSGYFIETRTGVFAHASQAQLAYNSPLSFATHLRRAIPADPLHVSMFVGRDDESSKQLLPMVHVLRADGAVVRYAIYPGGHDWSVWYPRLNGLLILASHSMGKPTPAPVTHRTRRRSGARLLAPVHPPRAPRPPLVHHRAPHKRMLVLALLLALLSAAAINLGFVLQHRGLTGRDPQRELLPAVLRSRAWLTGQALGWAGFMTQILAVALAPLSLVQAFAAGGLAVSVPIAAGLFGHRVSRLQVAAVFGTAAALFTLPIGFTGAHGPLHAGVVIGLSALAMASALGLGFAGASAARAIAAGIAYGVADAAIKADSIAIRGHGVAALASGWTILAALGTFAGFLAFQTALSDAQAVNAIALMSAFAALVALVLGVSAFGESLGSTPAATTIHLIAIAAVLACAAPLARTQHRLSAPSASTAPPVGAARAPGSWFSRPLAAGRGFAAHGVLASAGHGILRVAAGAAGVAALLVATVVGTGTLYALRGLGWLGVGPRVGDSLPLLQLAGFDGQPLVRVTVAWLVVGFALGIALIRLEPLRRGALVGTAGLLLLLLASDASYALARNLRFTAILPNRAPGLGPWLEGLLLAAGCAAAPVWAPCRSGVVGRDEWRRLDRPAEHHEAHDVQVEHDESGDHPPVHATGIPRSVPL
jgi:enterochelin esterase-like enzyme